jgi:chromosomal replication initiation ATPase DnaA
MRDRSQHVVPARQIAMYLIRKLGSYSFPRIGISFKRDHSTVIYACQKIARRAQEEAFARTLALLEKIVLENG